MQQYSVFTNEYDTDIELLLSRRLAPEENRIEIKKDDGIHHRVEVIIGGNDELRALSKALADMMRNDLKYFELTRLASNLPKEFGSRERIVREAAEKSSEYDYDEAIEEGIFEYLKENRELNLEGYLRFRLKDVIEIWSIFIDAAADEMMLMDEFSALTKLLGLFSVVEPPRSGKLIVFLNPDGSCTITNDREADSENSFFRIDCAAENNEGVISMLMGMSPRSIAIHDLSFGRCEKLRTAIETVFGARIVED